jgi:hypothetical protein
MNQQILPYEVFENSIGFFIGYKQGDKEKRVSLYYATEDQADAELKDGSWVNRIAQQVEA